MNCIKEAQDLLRKHATDSRSYRAVLAHSKAVRDIAVKDARSIPGADVQLVGMGAMLHDIGRFRYPPGKGSIRHGLAGGRILRAEGLYKIARIAERHVGAGLTLSDIKEQGLDLPIGRYVPRTIEEKVVCNADNLVSGDRRVSVETAVGRYRDELGEKYAERVSRLYSEVQLHKVFKGKRHPGKHVQCR
ncbi:MAG: HDIG domain-containing metalloprotein [archaeon]